MFTIVIGARVVRRPTPRCRALSKILFRRGLLVFCGTGGLVVSLLKVGLRLAVESIVWLFGVVLIVVSFSSLSFSIVFDGGKVVNLFLGRKKGLLLIPTFPVLPTGLRLGNKSDNFDFGLNLLLDLPPMVGRTTFSFLDGSLGSVVISSSSDSVDPVLSMSSFVVSEDND